jgi:L-lactate dehydrogenase complex protein LldG
MIPSFRDDVLGRIRTSLRSDGDRAAAEARLAARVRGVQPQYVESAVERFTAKALANLCGLERLPNPTAVPAAVARILSERGERALSIAPALSALPWDQAALTIRAGAGTIEERVSVTDALAGIGETGSLVFCSAADRPAGLNFLPELHIAVLRIDDIVPHMEDVWPKVRALPVWPRAVNVVSGPSRTADVAQIIVRPAHGPKALHILLLEASS